MATLAYIPLASTTLGSAASSVTFSSISGSYKDLVLVVGAGANTGSNVTLQLNGDTGSNYSRTMVAGDGTSASSTRSSNQTSIRLDENSYVGTTTNGSNLIIQFMNYSNSTTYKTILGRSNNAGVGTSAGAYLWRSTNAITSFVVSVGANTFNSGSTFNLYGIVG